MLCVNSNEIKDYLLIALNSLAKSSDECGVLAKELLQNNLEFKFDFEIKSDIFLCLSSDTKYIGLKNGFDIKDNECKNEFIKAIDKHINLANEELSYFQTRFNRGLCSCKEIMKFFKKYGYKNCFRLYFLIYLIALKKELNG